MGLFKTRLCFPSSRLPIVRKLRSFLCEDNLKSLFRPVAMMAGVSNIGLLLGTAEYHLFICFFIPAIDYISNVWGQCSFVDLSGTVQEHLTGALNPADRKIQSPVLVAGVLYLNSKLFFLHRTKPVRIVTVCLDNFETSGSLQRLPMHTLKHIPLGSFRGTIPQKLRTMICAWMFPFWRPSKAIDCTFCTCYWTPSCRGSRLLPYRRDHPLLRGRLLVFFFPVGMFVSFLWDTYTWHFKT